MALDWSREVSFAGLKRRSPAGKSSYPEKMTMNLAAGERSAGETRRTAVAAALIAVAVVLFVKFGVFDFYARVTDKQAELAVQGQALAAMADLAAEYDEVLAEYEGFESSSAMESGLTVDALGALSLVDRCVLPYARVVSLTLSGDTLSLNLAETSLDQLGRLVSSLEEQDIVSSATLSTAGRQNATGDGVTATVSVMLQAPGSPAPAGDGEVG